MLTLFASPKPFSDPHISLIQRNAIQSWLQLNPKPTIILFGNEPGTAEICREFGLVHVPTVQTNEFGTPLLNDIFRQAEAVSDSDLFCYVNADIIVMQDFMTALKVVSEEKRRFLMGARPWNVDVTTPLLFKTGWQAELAERVAQEGELRSERSCDIFAFPRGLWSHLPPFAVGRAYFDNALLHRTRNIGAALVDATPSVCCVHQNHGYAQHLDGNSMLTNVEAQRNVELAGGPGRLLTWKSSTFLVKNNRVEANRLGALRFFGPWSRTSKYVRAILGPLGPGRRTLGFRQS